MGRLVGFGYGCVYVSEEDVGVDDQGDVGSYLSIYLRGVYGFSYIIFYFLEFMSSWCYFYSYILQVIVYISNPRPFILENTFFC